MFSRQQTFRFSGRARRLLGLVLLLSVFASFIPLPIAPVQISVEKDRSEPFPCQDRPCGCRSAQQCWKKCCCFTNEQKLAWTRRNHIPAPRIVLEQIAREKRDTSLVHTTKCTAAGSVCRLSCCERPSSDDETQADASAPAGTSQNSSRYVLGLFVQQCHGGGLSWNSLPWSLLPPLVELPAWPLMVVAAPSFVRTLPAEVYDSPPVPPPRCVGSKLLSSESAVKVFRLMKC